VDVDCGSQGPGVTGLPGVRPALRGCVQVRRPVERSMLRRQANAEGGRERFSLGLKNLGRSRAQCATEGTHLERTAGSVDLLFARTKAWVVSGGS
jgi:hypothetical protein